MFQAAFYVFQKLFCLHTSHHSNYCIVHVPSCILRVPKFLSFGNCIVLPTHSHHSNYCIVHVPSCILRVPKFLSLGNCIVLPTHSHPSKLLHCTFVPSCNIYVFQNCLSLGNCIGGTTPLPHSNYCIVHVPSCILRVPKFPSLATLSVLRLLSIIQIIALYMFQAAFYLFQKFLGNCIVLSTHSHHPNEAKYMIQAAFYVFQYWGILGGLHTPIPQIIAYSSRSFLGVPKYTYTLDNCH